LLQAKEEYGEYDVIVVGFGGAGAAAASSAARVGARVLLSEKAPEGFEGGNTRYCGQVAVSVENRDEGLAYYRALTGDNRPPET
jgi:succinate dehydrogenase/fumarate reductase flavoprotein subunit